MRGQVIHFLNFLASEDGPTAVEYAVMLGLIVVAAISTISTIGSTVQAIFSDLGTRMNQ